MNYAIIVAAGKGKRMKSDVNKVFLPLLNKPIIYYTIKNFQDCSLIDDIIIAAQKSDVKKIEYIKQKYKFDKIKKIVEGGKERQDSVYNCLKSIKTASDNDIIIVHNGSNPLATENEIIECINAAKRYGASVAGFLLKDTIKKERNGFVENTIDRKQIYQVQTPQAVKYGLIVESFKNANKKNIKVSDDVSLVEALGKKVKIVPCSYENIKITTKDDLKIAEGILMKRKGISASFRGGVGQDSHRFSADKNKKLVLGGYVVPNEIGLEANSDGDVILHALFNAISSAISDRSLGYYSDEMCKKGITDSKEYLKVILDKLGQKNLKINNISIALEAGKPKLEMHTEKIKESLSKILDIEKEKIGITYTSGEGLTSFGQGKGMQCFALVMLC